MADPIDISEQWVEVALQGGEWECRDAGEGLSTIERYTGDDCQQFLGTALPYQDACHVERLLELLSAAQAEGRVSP